MNKIKIATVGASYAHRKNFLGLNQGRVSFSRAYDFLTPYRFMMRTPWIKKLLGSMLVRQIYIDSRFSSPAGYHFFNTLAVSSKPWITTFELSLPRWGNDRFGFKLMASKSCFRLIAMSESARDVQIKMVERHCPHYLDIIKSKLEVIHPNQKKNIQSWDEKNISVNDTLRMALVGNDFFRKGGMEILMVLRDIIRSGRQAKLILVSNLRINDYASKATEAMRIEALKLIEEYNQHIEWYQNVPNAEVFSLIKSCHIGLLPTYADTYGYSMLEFQSVGCPVVSTNVCVMPEINNNEKGWMIEVPQDEFREAFYRTAEERKTLSSHIYEGLKSSLFSILDNPKQIIEKGTKALEGLDLLHNPEKNASRYLELYEAMHKLQTQS